MNGRIYPEGTFQEIPSGCGSNIQGWKTIPILFQAKTNFWKKIRFSVDILLAILYLPAFFFHELCHIVVNIILGIKMEKFNWQWLELKPAIGCLTIYQLVINVNHSNKKILLLGVVAPLIGYLLLFIASWCWMFFEPGITLGTFIYLYVSLGWKYFIMSQGDWDAYASLKLKIREERFQTL